MNCSKLESFDSSTLSPIVYLQYCKHVTTLKSIIKTKVQGKYYTFMQLLYRYNLRQHLMIKIIAATKIVVRNCSDKCVYTS